MDTQPNGRNSNGTFAQGNPGGPGRPARTSELDYLRTTAQAVSLERWQRIVEKAAKDAEEGDWRAREFLGKQLLPTKPDPSKSGFEYSMVLNRPEDEDDPDDLDRILKGV